MPLLLVGLGHLRHAWLVAGSPHCRQAVHAPRHHITQSLPSPCLPPCGDVRTGCSFCTSSFCARVCILVRSCFCPLTNITIQSAAGRLQQLSGVRAYPLISW